jgi:hypothetical protein
MAAALCASAWVGALVLGACSSSGADPASSSRAGSTSPSVVDGITVPPPYVAPPVRVVAAPLHCPAGAAASLRAAGGAPVSTRSERTEHLLTCTYRLRPAGPGRCTGAVVRINTESQAFAAFDRWNVETGQNSMWGRDPALQPVPVQGVGVLAEWVPKLLELGAATSTTWASVVLDCPPGTPALPLATTLARQALAARG